MLDDARGEVARGLECVEFACGIPHLLKGAHSSEVSAGIDVHTVLQPVGVVAGITPFNFPVMVPLWMLANALACGNAFVHKPSEKDPSASLFLAELVQRGRVPRRRAHRRAGRRRGGRRAARRTPTSMRSRSSAAPPIARHIYETGAKHGKRVQALGGAKNHMVVLPDADVDAAADAAISAGYGSAGERCMAISVVVAVGAVADPLVEAIAARIPDVVVGPGDDDTVDDGTAHHRASTATGCGPTSTGADDEGATVVVDGSPVPLPMTATGSSSGCSLIDNVEPGMAVYDDEIFGPVLSVVRVPTLDDALALVNANPYGNGVALFTRDGGAARRFERDVNVGMVGINVPIPVPVAWHSFGGWKASLFGDAPIYGPEGIRFYTHPKVVTTRWPDPATSVIDLGFPTHR